MNDVISDSIHNEWITEDFQLGRSSVESLFELWNAALDAAQKRGGNIDLDNEVRSAREDLENALAAQEDSAWASEIRKRFRARKKSLPESAG